jgi:hypothetical protein
MKLANAAKYFDRVSVYDGYSDQYLFRAQFSSFDGRQADGTINKRRQMSIAPGIEVPAHRVISFDGHRWLLGDVNSDSLFDSPLRQTYVMKRVTGLCSLLTPGQAALAATGVQVYGQKLYMNNVEDRPNKAQYNSQSDIFLSVNQTVVKDSFIRIGTLYHYVRNVFLPLEGYSCATSDDIDEGNVTMQFNGESIYVPSTDSFVTSTVSTTGIFLDYYQNYEKATEADPKAVLGDKTLIVAASAITPLAGQTVVSLGKTWRIKTVYAYLDAWRLQVALA